jgi:hypothetical protein
VRVVYKKSQELGIELKFEVFCCVEGGRAQSMKIVFGREEAAVSCLNPECRHEAQLDVSKYWADTMIPSFIPRSC